jgi:hypothetical protein
MNALEYKPGEVVDITITAARLSTSHAQPPAVDHLGVFVDERYLRIPLGASVAITRCVPAEGMPKPGEVWETCDGRRVFVVEQRDRYDNTHIRFIDGTNSFHLEDLLGRGPLTPIWREEVPPAVVDPETNPEAWSTDEPEQLPIGGVTPGAIVRTPEWVDGDPVRIVSVEHENTVPETVKVIYEYLDGSGRAGRPGIPADFQVTPVSPEVYL